MTKVTSVLFLSVILFTSAFAATLPVSENAEAMKASGTSAGKIGSKQVCGDRLCSEYEGGRAEYETKKEAASKAIAETIEKLDKKYPTEDDSGKKFSSESDLLKNQLEEILEKIDKGMRLSKSEINIAKKAIQESVSVETSQDYYGANTQEAKGTPSAGQHAFGNTKSGTITSQQDPGLGHEAHQIAVILPPTDKVYVGKVTFSASEPVQYVTIHGPITEEENGGQPIWSPMGETKYALTFVDNGEKSGGWYFAGNALALHTKHTEPFTATYSVSYA